jgi:hypothetical protein
MGLIANVFRSGELAGNGLMRPTDCTSYGWSSIYDKVIIVNVPGPFEPESYTDYVPVYIRRHRSMPALHIVSVAHEEANKWTMMGGNFLYCSDSRFRQACNDIMTHGNDWPHKPDGRYRIHEHMSFGAIPIHDRVEG